jgi:hypothetical protein
LFRIAAEKGQNMRLRHAIAIGIATLGLAACQQPVGPQTGAGGAALGAAGGAAAGQLIGGDTRSTITGATLGAVGGGLAGAAAEQRQIDQQQAAPVIVR